MKVWCSNGNFTDHPETNSTDGVSPLPLDDDDWDAEKKCDFFFNLFDLSDWTVGLILLFAALFVLCGSLIFIVKILNSLLKGKINIHDMNGIF